MYMYLFGYQWLFEIGSRMFVFNIICLKLSNISDTLILTNSCDC